MSAEPQSLELVRREASDALERPLPPMDDGEVAALWRTSKALAESGLFKDARQAGQAFAKVLAGRDLGLTPFESMGSLHVIEGKVEASADLHATRVRQREGYDYRVAWLKIVPPAEGQAQTDPPRVEAVWADEEDPADLRDTYGCVVAFTIDGKRRGLARWTDADTVRAGLGGKDNHRKYPRSMHFARAMSQGVALHVPEVMGGLRVYAPGELGRGESGEDLGAGAGDAAPAMDSLPTAVEAVIARARELGHAGLANRARWATLAGQPAEQIGQAVARATRELNAHAARQRRGEPEPEAPEPPDAEVVEGPAPIEPERGPEVTDSPSENKPVSAPDTPEPPTTTPEPADAPQEQTAPAERDESAEVVNAEPVHDPEHASEHVAALEHRAEDLRARLDEAKSAGEVDAIAELAAELDAVELELDAATNPDQGSLGL